MGFLTTFTISNEGIDNLDPNNPDFEKNAKELAFALFNAGTGLLATPADGAVSVGIGNHANMLKIQIPRHADNNTIYIHSGGTLCEMNAYCVETRRIIEKNPKFADDMIFLIKHQAENLAILLKQVFEAKKATKS
jgi:hypothetical protein